MTAADPGPTAVDDRWAAWAARRPLPNGVHVDSAAASRASFACLDATVEYLRGEAEQGAYVLAERSAEVFDELRTGLAETLGVETDGVVLVDGAAHALDTVLRVAPIARGDAVLVAPSEWGPNLAAFVAAGLEVRMVAVDDTGSFDLDALDRTLAADPPAFVHVTPQASHRALRQPADEILGVCRRHGVALWVDAAQSVGHHAVPAGADVVYGTSRKWLAGPRGIGFLGIGADYCPRLRLDRVAPSMRPGAWPLDAIETHEANYAGRVGLAIALGEYRAAAAAIHERLTAVGRAVRAAVDELAGWRNVDPVSAPGAITAIEATAGQDVFTVRQRLLAEHGVVTTAGATARAPHDMTVPTLRLSPHVDATDEQIDTVIAALAAVSA